MRRLGTWIKMLIGGLLLVLITPLPYRARVAVSEAMGWTINATYQLYLRMLKWLMRQLEDDPKP